MAKVIGTNPHLTATYCPGTMGYMSPEALREPPAYTAKLDIFSFGVLNIQIITRKFPDPGPRFNQIEISDPRIPLGRVDVPVPERERRKSHIDLIDPTHPLLMIALDCLKDKEEERPLAEQLCSYLAALKEAPRYQESHHHTQQVAQSLHEEAEAQPEPQMELLQQNQELQQQLEEREETLQAREREMDDLLRSMEQLRLQSERQAQEKEIQIQQKERDNFCLQYNVRQKDEQVQQLRRELHQTSRESKQLVAALQQNQELRQQLEESEVTLQVKEKEVEDLFRSMEQLQLQSERQAQEKETLIQQKERDNFCLQDEVRQKDEQVQQLRLELHQASQESEQVVATLQQNQKLQQQLEKSEETVQAKEREVNGLLRCVKQLQQEMKTQIQQKEIDIQQKEGEIRQKERGNCRLQHEVHQKGEQVQQLRCELHQTNQNSEQLVATLLDSLEQKDEVIRSKDAALQEKKKQMLELQQSQGGRRKKSTAAQPLQLQWRNGPKAPFETYGESSTIHGRISYFYSWKKKIMMYNSETGGWAILPACPKGNFSISMVNGLLTAIGGFQSSDGKDTKTLLSFTEQQKWMERLPPMNYYHNLPAVACTSTSLIVAGGWGPDQEQAPVEVMDTNTLCWSTAASLPHPWSQATVTICRDRLYMAGGWAKDNKTNSVLTCVVSELLQSTATAHQSLGVRPTIASGLQPPTNSHNVWQEIAPLPVCWSSLVTFHGHLLAVGGCDSDYNPTSAVYQYDTTTNSWQVISHMNSKRFQCFTSVLPDHTLLVAGGIVKPYIHEKQERQDTDSVEIASCM